MSSILGPIAPGATFVLGFNDGATKRICAYSSTLKVYYFDSNIDNLLAKGTYSRFTAQPYGSGVLLFDIQLQEYVTFSEYVQNGIVHNTISPTSQLPPQPANLTLPSLFFVMKFTSQVVPWDGSVLMSTTYHLTSVTGLLKNPQLYTSTNPSIFTNVPLSSVQVIPVNLYYNSTCTLSSSPGTAILQYVCPGGSLSCLNTPFPAVSWTTSPLCQDRQVFNYCVGDERCGESNCNGPCAGGSAEVANVCHLDSNGNNQKVYTCTPTPVPPAEVPWWQSAWFIWSIIGLILFVGVMVAVVILLLIVRSRRRNREEEEAANEAEERRFNRLVSGLV